MHMYFEEHSASTGKHQFNTVLKEFSFVSMIEKKNWLSGGMDDLNRTENNSHIVSSADSHFLNGLASMSNLPFKSMVASLASPRQTNYSKVELFTSMGRDFNSTAKLTASTGKEYCIIL